MLNRQNDVLLQHRLAKGNILKNKLNVSVEARFWKVLIEFGLIVK